MNNEVNLADIRAFVVIAKAGSFTAAAEQLCCSRSHLSKQLVQLESRLGAKLIVRTTRSQRLTEQGMQFFERCSRALDGIDNAIELVTDSAQAMAGKININCVGGYIGEDIITPLINDFIKQYPEIKISLDFSSQRVDLVAGEFDIVFRMGKLEDSNLIARKLMDIPIVTLASPGYLKQSCQLTHPKDLKRHHCITGTVNTWRFISVEKPGIKLDVVVDGFFQCKNGRAMINGALADNGVVRVPSLYCKQEIANGALIPVFTDWIIPATPLYLVYVQDKFQPTRLQSFIRFVSDNIYKYITGN